MSHAKFDYTLMAPGPVNLHPEVRKILSEPMIHHRTPEFDKILQRVLSGLKFLFETTQPVYMQSSTGSGGMESLLVNTLSPRDDILCIVSGKFGERWAEMGKTFGLNVTELSVPWGDAVNVSQVESLLKEKKFKAVLTQACETSTAVYHPIKELGELISNYPNTLFLVDGITALGAMPLPMDQWHIDGLVGGSQKAFMLPTGMSFLCFSEKAEKEFINSKIPKFYFDIKKEKKANQNGETFFSSNVSLIKALDFVLSDIKQKGLKHLFAENARRSQWTHFVTRLLNLEIYSQATSTSLTAIKIPAGIDGQKIRSELESEYNLTVMGGQEQLKGKIIRVGHMGYLQDHDLNHFLEALYFILKKHNHIIPSENNDIEILKVKSNEWLSVNSISKVIQSINY